MVYLQMNFSWKGFKVFRQFWQLLISVDISHKIKRYENICEAQRFALPSLSIHLVSQHKDVDSVEEGAEDADHHGEVAVDGLVGILK